jgi:hypothetical protein
MEAHYFWHVSVIHQANLKLSLMGIFLLSALHHACHGCLGDLGMQATFSTPIRLPSSANTGWGEDLVKVGPISMKFAS